MLRACHPAFSALALSTALLALVPATAQAESAQTEPAYPTALVPTADALKLDLGGLFAILSWSGFNDWKWGSASFRFQSEGWFGMDTGSGGQDKLGHAFSSYLMAEFLYLRLRSYYGRQDVVTPLPALFSWTLMLYVEFFDGFSVDHGFSYEDLLMDAAGATASFLRQRVPGLARAFDFRMEYYPSAGMRELHPMIDYSGQKFLLALKPAGFGAPKESFLDLVELHLGYYTRGFSDDDAPYFREKQAHLYFGLGANLERILFEPVGPREAYAGTPLDYAHAAVNYFQLPATTLQTDLSIRRAAR